MQGYHSNKRSSVYINGYDILYLVYGLFVLVDSLIIEITALINIILQSELKVMGIMSQLPLCQQIRTLNTTITYVLNPDYICESRHPLIYRFNSTGNFDTPYIYML